MSGDPLAPLDRVVADLTSDLSPAGRRKLAGEIARDVQRSAIRRLKANTQSDGSPMAPRKRGSDGLRPKSLRMFQKAASTRYLKRMVTAGGARVGFFGNSAQIMSVHEYGLRDAVSPEPSAPQATYPEREVIGLSAADRATILDRALSHLI